MMSNILVNVQWSSDIYLTNDNIQDPATCADVSMGAVMVSSAEWFQERPFP